MNRKLRVKVSKHSDPDAVVSAGMRRLSRRVLRKLTGQSGRCAVLLPGRDVQSIEIIDNDQATSSHKRRDSEVAEARNLRWQASGKHRSSYRQRPPRRSHHPH